VIQEHIQDTKTDRQNSTYGQHIIDTGHTYGTIIGTSEVFHTKKKGKLLNSKERFHIYNFSKQKRQMNDTFADTHNPILNLIINTYWFNIMNKLHKLKNTPPFPPSTNISTSSLSHHVNISYTTYPQSTKDTHIFPCSLRSLPGTQLHTRHIIM
jgi:hypothetical protein